MQNGAAPARRPRGVLIREGNNIRLTDLDTAAYLRQHKVAIIDAVKTPRHKRPDLFEFSFHDPERRAEALAMEYINSCCVEHAFSVECLKKVLHRFHGKDRLRQKGNGARDRPGYDVREER